jgi:hypothetical protein
MSRPARFEHNRYLGDKRSLVVYDLDMYGSDERVTERVDELIASERFLTFGPDILPEARNRNYHPDRSITRAVAAAEE